MAAIGWVCQSVGYGDRDSGMREGKEERRDEQTTKRNFEEESRASNFSIAVCVDIGAEAIAAAVVEFSMSLL